MISQGTPDEKSRKLKEGPDDCREYTDSEVEEHGMWYDLSVKIPRNRVDEEISEPFSMDLDVAWDEMTGQPEVIES